LAAGTFTGGVSEASFEYEYHFIEYEYEYERVFLATITCGQPILVAVYGGTIGEHRFREIVGEQWFRPGRGFRPTKSGNFTDS
jgi:hypothetical protein